MTAQQRLLSWLFIAHLGAIFIAAIPGLADFGEGVLPRGADKPVTPLTAALDRAAVELVWLHRVTSSMIQPVARPAFVYVRVTAQFQKWNMFSNPSRVHQYARIGYRLRLRDGIIRTEYEEVFPAGPTDVLKLVSAYFDSFMDKVMSNAGETYRTLSARARADGERVPTDEMVRSLRPYTDYYGRRRVKAGLPNGAELVAVEFWWGTRPSAPPPSVSTTTIAASPPPIEWKRWAVQYWP